MKRIAWIFLACLLAASIPAPAGEPWDAWVKARLAEVHEMDAQAKAGTIAQHRAQLANYMRALKEEWAKHGPTETAYYLAIMAAERARLLQLELPWGSNESREAAELRNDLAELAVTVKHSGLSDAEIEQALDEAVKATDKKLEGREPH